MKLKKILTCLVALICVSCGSRSSTKNSTETSENTDKKVNTSDREAHTNKERTEDNRYSECNSRKGTSENNGKYRTGQKLNLERFSEKLLQRRHKEILRDPLTGEYLEQDLANNAHRGIYYELKDRNACRIATVSRDGTIVDRRG